MEIATEVGMLHVEEHGTRGMPSVLLWPSLYCTGAIWQSQLATLTARHHVLVLDPPGHGRSGLPPRRFSLDATARATSVVLDAVDVDTVVLIGGAWGGMVGVQMAVSERERLRGLVLVNSPLDRWQGRKRLAIWGLAGLLAAGGPRAAAPFLTGGMLSKETRRVAPEKSARLATQLRKLRWLGLFRAARSAMLDRPSLLPLLPSIDLPVLAIAGAQDTMWPPDRARAEVAAIKGCRFVTVDGTAHLSAFEAPDAVNALLVEFLEQVALGSDVEGRS